ncbi:MAG TPA: serine/threonine-protein kinase, partial [Ktedonobacteraceae bacterium]|nr:serine/threonine-protein kinase [Ktedonobacteraceae bacterium]
MAEVYLARNEQTNELAAIKMVPNDSSEQSQRFLREAKITTTLHHAHILPALACGEYDMWEYLITPYVAFGTLRDHLAQGPLPLPVARLLFAQLTNALQYAHERGILHRDIKASNVLLRDMSYAYLADFGLVKSAEDEYSLTKTGYTVGTPEYMAPELLEREATPASDIYALGILLYQMLTGTLPFRGSTSVATIIKHIKEQPAPPSTLNAHISPEVEAVIMRALQKKPQQRYQTMREFYQAFEDALALEDQACTARHEAVHVASVAEPEGSLEPTVVVHHAAIDQEQTILQPVQPIVQAQVLIQPVKPIAQEQIILQPVKPI